MLAALAVARTAPGALSFGYVLHWVALVGVAAALVVGAEAASLWPRLAAALRGGPGRVLLLLACALLLAGNVREWREAATPPRHPDSVRAEALAQAVRAQLAVETRWPFLLRVGPGADPRVALGLILALDKAHLRFTVEPFGPYLLVGRFTPRGDEVGQLLLGDIPRRPREAWPSRASRWSGRRSRLRRLKQALLPARSQSEAPSPSSGPRPPPARCAAASSSPAAVRAARREGRVTSE